MGQNFSDVCRTLAEYHCPRYEELPHIALYKDQVVSVLNEAVGPFYPQGETPVTATMVNNYGAAGKEEIFYRANCLPVCNLSAEAGA